MARGLKMLTALFAFDSPPPKICIRNIRFESEYRDSSPLKPIYPEAKGIVLPLTKHGASE